MAWKKPVIDNTPIKFDSTRKTIELLIKKRAHRFIAFQPVEYDNHFIDLFFVSKKTLMITDELFIISKDLNGWVKYLNTMGWESHKDIEGFLGALKNENNNENGEQ